MFRCGFIKQENRPARW